MDDKIGGGTGQTPMIVRTLTESDNNNPYSERGFKRGMENKPRLRKFLCCLNLSIGLLFSTLFDYVQIMVWIIFVFVRAETIQWPFYLVYVVISITRLYYFYKFNKKDSEEVRFKLYRAHRTLIIVLALVQLFQITTTYISLKRFPASLICWMLLSIPFGSYLVLIHW